MNNNWVYGAALAVGLFVVAAAGAADNKYPAKAVRVVVPYPPGEAADVIARLIAPVMGERMGQQFIVDNRAGASGQIGLDLLKNAPADGYTIGVGQGGNLAVAPHTYKKLPYDPIRDFAAVALNATNYLALVANPNVPFKNAGDMIAWAKGNPGKLSLATNGEGGFPHLAFELLAQMGGFQFLHVPYKGAAQITTDVIAGQVQLGIGSYTAMSPHIDAGRIRLIGVTNPTRVPGNPNMPILAEAVPGYDMRGWFGYIAPAGVPRDIVRRLNAEINYAMQQPAVTAKLAALGLIVTTESPEYFDKFVKSESAKFAKLVKAIKFEPR